MSDQVQKSPLPSVSEEDTQQALGTLWSRRESGVTQWTVLEPILDVEVRRGILQQLANDGYVEHQGPTAALTDRGHSLAKDVVRRRRLAERLLADVLTVTDEQVSSTACRLEHILSSDVEQAICTLLGHPEACPHGLEIPRGVCCERASTETQPIVVPLAALSAGESARIAYVSPIDRPELHKFLAMGLVPGTPVRVEQTFPALVIAAMNTLLGMDPAIARHVFVRRTRPSPA